MKNLLLRKGFIFGILLLFVGTSLLPSISGNIENEKEIKIINEVRKKFNNDDKNHALDPEIGDVSLSNNVPTWQIGNNWKYYVECEGEFGSSLSYNWAFENMIFTVTADTGVEYTLTLNADVIGELTISSIQLIKGQLKETTMVATCSVDKSNIGLKELDAHMEGKISIINIPIYSFTMDVDVTFTPSFSSVSFPISVNKEWLVPQSKIEGTLTTSLLANPTIISDVIGGDNARCIGIETITVTAGTFDAYKITSDGDIEEWFYAQDAGNVIKAFGDVDNRVDITLMSTNYEVSNPGAPNKPSRPSGATSGTPGTSYDYSTSTTDNQGDQIYYLFDWGDSTNSGWLGSYDSGATCVAKHTWNSKGNYNIKVKAKDIHGNESAWSDPLPITMPYSHNSILHFFEWLFQRFPNAFPVLNNY